MTTITEDRARLAELAGIRSARAKSLDNITNHITIREEKSAPGGKVVEVSTDEATAFRQTMSEIKQISDLEREISDAISYKETGRLPGLTAGRNELEAMYGPSAAVAGGAGAEGAQTSFKSVGEAFSASENRKSLTKAAVNMSEPWAFKGDLTSHAKGMGLHAMEKKDVYTALAPTYTNLGFGTVQVDPMVPQQMRTQRVRDLFPTANTSANMIEYYRVLGLVGTDVNGNTITGQYGNAGMVPERVTIGGVAQFGLKPHSTLDFENDQAIVRTIAHWEAAHRNVLDDEPQLQSIINNELLYGLRLVEDYQILNGDGTGENLRGILRTPGIQTYVADVDTPEDAFDENKGDSIRRAITRSILAYYDPSGVIIHPFDWEEIELTKNTQGSYIVSTAVAIGAQKQLWRLPVVDTPAMSQGQFLVGSFGLGAQIYDRQDSNIRTADQHADFFIRNALVILAEERLALAVKRPESFVLGTFATGPVGQTAGSLARGDDGSTEESVTIDPTTANITYVAPGNTVQLTVNAVGAGRFESTETNSATYASSDTTKATVNATGLVTGVAAGTTQITATFNGVTSAPCTVTVS
jgi:hypothetical protein